MRLEKASHKAIKYACMNFHYAKAVPVNVCGYSVFNDDKEWCGVVLFGLGASPYVSQSLGMKQGQAAELVRVALNGKQKNVSSVLSIAIKIFKKQNPLVKILFSYADIDQCHQGTIYQATNWYFIGNVNENQKSGYIVNGKKIHARVPNAKGIKNSIDDVRKHLDPNAEEYISKGKRKYIYPLDNSLVHLCQSLAKPYPKKHAAVAHTGEQLTSSQDGAFDSTLPLKTT